MTDPDAAQAVRLAVDAALLAGDSYRAGVPDAIGSLIQRTYADAMDRLLTTAAGRGARAAEACTTGTRPHERDRILRAANASGSEGVRVVVEGMAALLQAAVAVAAAAIEAAAEASGQDRSVLAHEILEGLT